MTLTAKPTLSIIVISFNPLTVLDKCIKALEAQVGCADAEVIIIRDESRAVAYPALPANFRWDFLPAGATVPEMRSRGAAIARGQAVAFLEDDCQVGAGWSEIVYRFAGSDHDIVSGTIEPDLYPQPKSWGIFFCEYGRFMSPRPFKGTLPGNHIVFKHKVLMELLAELPDGMRDFQVNNLIFARGYNCLVDPELQVTNINDWHAFDILKVPYHHGRTFAAKRFSRFHWQRIFLGAGTPVLPFVFVVRVMHDIFARRRFRKEAILAFPYMFLFSSAWAAGEFFGYFFGAGQSADQWA